ncbi:E2F6 [Enterospora canceri]|uniref:E2F6 n=1 Tax=Enterospora canceri TaxID=1081671 RepID=A0A1Y1S5G0_9MICR|nr:E2F6 [Enterospora canceri]
MDGSERRQADCVPLNPIEQEIEELNRDLQDISACRDNLENAFVSYTDIKSVKQLNDKLLFAIKAPDETSIEYPKYEKGSYRMKISTDKGEISVFYIDNKRHSTKKE